MADFLYASEVLVLLPTYVKQVQCEKVQEIRIPPRRMLQVCLQLRYTNMARCGGVVASWLVRSFPDGPVRV